MDDFERSVLTLRKGKSMRKQKKQRESGLEQVQKEHPILSPAAQEAVARLKKLSKRSERLGDWKLHEAPLVHRAGGGKDDRHHFCSHAHQQGRHTACGNQ
jgi:hypothetical protein